MCAEPVGVAPQVARGVRGGPAQRGLAGVQGGAEASRQALGVEHQDVPALGVEFDAGRLPAAEHAERRGQRGLDEVRAVAGDQHRRAVPGAGQRDPAFARLHPGVDGGGGARGFGGLEQQFEVAEDGDRVLALQHRVRPQRRPDPAHRGRRTRRGPGAGARPVAGDAADAQPEGAVRQGDGVVPVAAGRAVERGGCAARGQPDAGQLRQVVGQQAPAQCLAGAPGALRRQLGGQQRGGGLAVRRREPQPPLRRVGGLVVEPDGGGQRAVLLGGQRQPDTGAEAELAGHLAQARPGRGVAGQVGVQQPARAAVYPQQPADGPLAGRYGLQRAEAGPVQAEADGPAGAVGRGGHHEAAPGAEQGRPGAEHGGEGGVQAPGAGEQHGVLVQLREVGEVGEPPGRVVRAAGAAGAAGAAWAVCRPGRAGGGRHRTRGGPGGREAERHPGAAAGGGRAELGRGRLSGGQLCRGRVRRGRVGLGHAATPSTVVRVMRNPLVRPGPVGSRPIAANPRRESSLCVISRH